MRFYTRTGLLDVWNGLFYVFVFINNNLLIVVILAKIRLLISVSFHTPHKRDHTESWYCYCCCNLLIITTRLKKQEYLIDGKRFQKEKALN